MRNYDVKTFYKNVKYLCKTLDMKQCAVEMELGVAKGYLCRAMLQGYEIGASKALRVAEFFQVPVERLFEEDFEKENLK